MQHNSTSVLNNKSTFLNCYPTNVDLIQSDYEPWENKGNGRKAPNFVMFGWEPADKKLICCLGRTFAI